MTIAALSFLPPVQPTIKGHPPKNTQSRFNAGSDTVHFSGQQEHREAAKKYADLRGFNGTQFDLFLGKLKNSLQQLLESGKLKLLGESYPDLHESEQGTAEVQLFLKALDSLKEMGAPAKVAELFIEAIQDTYTEDELKKLNKLYSDPETAALLNKQLLVFKNLLENPTSQTEIKTLMGDVVEKLGLMDDILTSSPLG